MPVDIAFVTVNFNTLEYVKRLTDFFTRLDVPFTFSFTVVDNNSHDGSQEYLQAHPEIHYLQTGENIGYGPWRQSWRRRHLQQIHLRHQH